MLSPVSSCGDEQRYYEVGQLLLCVYVCMGFKVYTC